MIGGFGSTKLEDNRKGGREGKGREREDSGKGGEGRVAGKSTRQQI
jgi:hypothetical protein